MKQQLNEEKKIEELVIEMSLVREGILGVMINLRCWFHLAKGCPEAARIVFLGEYVMVC